MGVLQPHRQRVPQGEPRIRLPLREVHQNVWCCKAWRCFATAPALGQVSFHAAPYVESSLQKHCDPAPTTTHILCTTDFDRVAEIALQGAQTVVADDYLQQNAEPEPSLDAGQPRQPWIRRSFCSSRRTSTSAAR